MLDGLSRSASVVAVREAELFFVSRVKFEESTRQHPEIYKHLVALLASRLPGIPLRGPGKRTLAEGR